MTFMFTFLFCVFFIIIVCFHSTLNRHFPDIIDYTTSFYKSVICKQECKKKSIFFLLSFFQTNNNNNDTIRNITINNKNIITLKSFQNQKPTSEKCTISTIFPFKGFVICLEFKFIRIL
jgi:hypothetical protein